MMGKEKTGEKGWGERVGSCSRVKGCHGDSAAERNGQTHGTTYKSERMEKGTVKS